MNVLSSTAWEQRDWQFWFTRVTARRLKTARTRWSGLVCVLYAQLIRMCAIVGHGFYFKTLVWKKNAKWTLGFEAFCSMQICAQSSAQQRRPDKHMSTLIWRRSQKNVPFCCSRQQFLVVHKSVDSLEVEKKWLPSWQECPVMTHGHMHYKACEMHPILKPVMVQNNADYCQINRQTSFNENSLCCLHKGEPSQSEPWRGRSLRHAFEVWGDLLQQLP